jgi:hypothetical protein
MKTGVQARPRGLGVAGSLVGLLALIAAVMPQWLLPVLPSAGRAEPIAVERRHSLKERILEKLKPVTPEKQEARHDPDRWRPRFLAAAVSLALLAITLAVFSVFRREDRLYAGLAAALGIAALAFQLTILSAGAVIAILVLYAVLGQHESVFPQPAFAIGAIFALTIVTILVLGLASPMLAALLIGAAIVIFGIYSLLDGF